MKRVKTSEMRLIQLRLFCPTDSKIASLNSRKQAMWGSWGGCMGLTSVCLHRVRRSVTQNSRGKITFYTTEVGADCGRCQTECLRHEVTESGEPIRTRAPFCPLSGDPRLWACAAFRENHGHKSRRSANMDEV